MRIIVNALLNAIAGLAATVAGEVSAGAVLTFLRLERAPFVCAFVVAGRVFYMVVAVAALTKLESWLLELTRGQIVVQTLLTAFFVALLICVNML